MTEIVPYEQNDPWNKKESETDSEYKAFEEYCKIGSERSYRITASTTGHSLSTIQSYARKHKWATRAKQYDMACLQLVPLEASPSETLAIQYAAGKIMLDLGLQAIQLKDPRSIRMQEAIKLAKLGSDLQRTALGIDDGNTFNINLNGAGLDALNEIIGEIEGFADEED